MWYNLPKSVLKKEEFKKKIVLSSLYFKNKLTKVICCKGRLIDGCHNNIDPVPVAENLKYGNFWKNFDVK